MPIASKRLILPRKHSLRTQRASAMSTTSRRSSSVSSASSSGNSTSPKSKSNIAGIKKKFACTHDGCGKSFSRSEHLHRHALNHKDGNNTCLRCSAHFRRRDLLDRHMARHKEKDDEAGGEGLGFLATRKRLWRDPDGNIVNCRRPSQEGLHQSKRRVVGGTPETTQRRRSSAGSMAEKPTPIAVPLSPPISIPSTASASGSISYTHNDPTHEGIGVSADGILNHSPMLHEAWNVDPMLSAMSTTADDCDFLCNSGWGTQPPVNSFEMFMGGAGGSDLPYEDDIFKPDTAMSFNAPFTTPSYYSWLFDKDSSNLEMPTDEPTPQLPNSATPNSVDKSASLNSDSNSYSSNMPVTPSHDFPGEHLDLLNSELDSPSNEVPAILASMHMQTEPNGLFRSQSKDNNLYHSHLYSSLDVTLTRQVTPFSDERQSYGAPKAQRPLMPKNPNSSDANVDVSDRPRAQPLDNHVTPSLPPDAYPTRDSTSCPKITNQARDGLMQLIGHSRPCKPNGNPILSSDPLLSMASLQNYSNLFFSRFNSSYPLIHQATFDPSNVHPFLLMAILLLGATYSDKEAHLLAVCIHDIMRPLIHSSKDFSTKPKFWMLQTILLVECFGKSRAGEKQHDMSHLYHGLLINLIRRSDCQSAYIPPFNEELHDLDSYWREAVIAEQKRRLAMLCFMWDTQHAVLFSQSLCMNASELKLTLPWDPSIWEATTAQEWHHLTTNTPSPPQYLSVLRSYTAPTPSSSSPNNNNFKNLNALSRVLILHGLMSLAWDLQRRDQTSVGLSNLKSSITTTSETDSWQARISHSYDTWKVDFENYTSLVLSAISPHSSGHSKANSRKASYQRFAVANMAIYHTAKMILAVDLIDLQIFAGARHIIGRVVTSGDRERSRRRIVGWLSDDRGKGSAAEAVWHAARLFRDGLIKLERWGVDDMFHYPWCLYLASLMVFVFHEAAVGIGRPSNGGHPAHASPSSTSKPALSHHGDRRRGNQHEFAPPRSGTTNNDNEEDTEWDAAAEMSAFISAITRLPMPPQGAVHRGLIQTTHTLPHSNAASSWAEEIWLTAAKFKTAGLLKCMVKQLNTVRWAVVREGMIVLRGLVG